MGVSISIRPGSVMRSKGEPVTITPGMRSRAASILTTMFGQSPFEIHKEDLPSLESMALGASLYVVDENMWQQIIDMVNEHDVVTMALEY